MLTEEDARGTNGGKSDMVEKGKEKQVIQEQQSLRCLLQVKTLSQR